MNGAPWEMLTAIASIAVAVAAVVALLVESRRSRFTQQMDLLLRREELFEGKEMRERRMNAADALLARDTENQNVDEVLEFLETLGYLTRHKALDEGAVWGVFFYWVHRYMCAASERIRAEQSEDPTVWGDAVWLHRRLMTIEKKERRCSDVRIALSDEDLDDFFEEEKQLA